MTNVASCGCTGVMYARGLCRNCYQRLRNRQKAYGRWDPRMPVAAGAARAHVEVLRAAGVNATQLARLAGVTHSTIGRIAEGSERITAQVEAAVLGVGVPGRVADVTAATALVPIHGARRRVQALIASGHPRMALARELGVATNSGQMSALLGHRQHGGRVGSTITAEREQQVKALFDRLQFVAGPSERARARGRRHGWALPFEWDETALDDPQGRPTRARWTARSSTRERREQVDALTAAGLSTTQIADRLATTTRTVERDRVHMKTHAVVPDSEIRAMGEVVVAARRDIAARRRGAPTRRERTR